MTYPIVLGEYDTLSFVANGASLARFGDGEFNLCRGGRAKKQSADPALAQRLRGILRLQSRHCLVGIPNIHAPTPKKQFWSKYADIRDLVADTPYASAFISRPDSAPWIDTPQYWALLESLWRGKSVMLVRGSENSLVPADLEGANVVSEIVGPPEDAWASYPSLLERVRAMKPSRVLICLGPTATVMAVDLAAQGIHAIDLGHIGRFLRKKRAGEPLVVTDADRAT